MRLSLRSIVLLLASFAFSFDPANNLSDPSNSALSFLHLPVSARVAALGGAVTAYGQDAASAFINPALTGLAPDIRISGSYEQMALDRMHNFGGVIIPLLPKHAIGVGWSIYGVDEIERRSDYGILEGTFNDRENVVAGFYSYGDSSRLLGGISTRYYYQKLDNIRADGYGVDAGLYYHPIQMVRLGLVGQNLLGSMNWSTKDVDRIAPVLRVGGALFPYKNSFMTSLMLSADAEYTQDNSPQAHGGVETWFKNMFCIRLGLEAPNPIQYSGGFGLRYQLFAVDYAFTHHESELGNSHLYSISVDIGGLLTGF